jgi:hypothetical protein
MHQHPLIFVLRWVITWQNLQHNSQNIFVTTCTHLNLVMLPQESYCTYKRQVNGTSMFSRYNKGRAADDNFAAVFYVHNRYLGNSMQYSITSGILCNICSTKHETMYFYMHIMTLCHIMGMQSHFFFWILKPPLWHFILFLCTNHLFYSMCSKFMHLLVYHINFDITNSFFILLHITCVIVRSIHLNSMNVL